MPRVNLYSNLQQILLLHKSKLPKIVITIRLKSDPQLLPFPYFTSNLRRTNAYVPLVICSSGSKGAALLPLLKLVKKKKMATMLHPQVLLVIAPAPTPGQISGSATNTYALDGK